MSIPATKNGMPPIHPGEFVEEILEDLDMSQAALARAIGVSPINPKKPDDTCAPLKRSTA